MFRPTPGRLIYLLIGLVIGAVVLTAYSTVAGVPAFLPTGIARQASVQPKVPTQFSAATLSRVVTANQVSSKAGVTVRVNAVEVYAEGFSLTYSILSGLPGEPATVLQPERFTVVDDRGGSYNLSVLASSNNVGPGMSTGYLAFTPALSPDAKSLTVSVPHLMIVSGASDAAGASRVVDGPWQVLVTLR